MSDIKDKREDSDPKAPAVAGGEPQRSSTGSGGPRKPAAPTRTAAPSTATPEATAYRDPRCATRHVRGGCGCTGLARGPIDPKVKFPALPSKK